MEDAPDLAAEAADAVLTISTELAQLQSNAVTHDASVVQQIYPISKPTEVHPVTLQGAVANDVCTSAVSWIVRYYDDQYSRRKTYHWRYGGLSEGATDKGRLDGLFIAAHNVLISTITNSIGIATTNARFRVVSPVSRIPFDPPYRDIMKANVNPITSRLRSRQLRLG
jgi:hypothetical protein